MSENKDIYNIAIIGPKEITFGFKTLGVIPLEAKNSDEVLAVLKKIKKDIDENRVDVQKFAMVMVIENLLETVPNDEIAKITSGALPAVLALPGLEGSCGAGVSKLKQLAEKAIGSNILAPDTK